MDATFRKSFVRDLKKLKDKTILDLVRRKIEQVDAAADPHAIGDMTKLGGTDNCFRIRIGEYRIGVVIEGSAVELVRCLPRRDLHRFFP